MHGQAGTESWVSPVDKKRELNNRLARRPHHHGQPTSWRYTLSCLVNALPLAQTMPYPNEKGSSNMQLLMVSTADHDRASQ